MSYTLPAPTYKDWLRGWKEWACTRKRGTLAQFVIDKLEDNKQASWIDITIGKFELTQWHTIAEEWFKEKPRNSDLVDAPCLLRKGLPRAFPGLEEVKSESIKKGMQYKSRVFQATPYLVQEVMDKGGFTKPQPHTNYPMAAPQTHDGLPSGVGGEIVLHPQEQIAKMEKDKGIPVIIVEEWDALMPTSISSSFSADDQGKLYQPENTTRISKMLITADADLGVSMAFDHDKYENEILLRNSCSVHNASSGYISLNMSTIKGVDVTIDPDEGETFANSVQYEPAYIILEDYPAGGKEEIFKAGDRIMQIGSTPVQDKGLDEFEELLQREAPKGTTFKIIPCVEHTPPPSSSAYLSVTPSLSGGKRQLVQRPSELQTLEVKVAKLLTMRATGTKRTVTIARTKGDYGFKMIGGNAVGLFIIEIRPFVKNVMPGDQILKVNGQDTRHMTHFEASEILKSSEIATLEVTKNIARFKTIMEQFEFDSFFIRSCIDYTSTDPRDMVLHQGTLIRVVNTTMYGGYLWLAWTVDESTGLDCELRRIPSPARLKKTLYGKDAYERVTTPQLKDNTSE